MKNLEFKIEKLLDDNFKTFGLNSTPLKEQLRSSIINEIKRDYNNNLINLLEFCKIVEKEKNGLLFIKKIIESIILENNSK